MTFKHPSEIYAEEMAKYREGYGLWIPDPRDTGVPQAEIGDVGFISDGAFDLLFNYSTESSHLVSVNPPDNLDKRKIFHRKHKNVFGPGFYRSTSVRELECALSGGYTQAGASVEFTCESKQGAILDILSAADTEYLIANRYLRNFVKQSYPRWVTYAEDDRGLDSKTPVVFVYGHMRTTGDWITTTFSGRGRLLRVTLGGGLPGIGEAGLSLAKKRYGDVMPIHHHGPLVTLKRDPGVPRGIYYIPEEGARNGLEPQDKAHTLFLKCFRMKKRLGIFRLRGGAGPRRIEVDWDRDEPTETAAAESSDEDTDSVDESDEDKTGDPLEPLLDYILENSTAATAIACTDDLYLILPSYDWPTDTKTYLQKMLPQIDVDERQVGAFSVIDAIQRKTRCMASGLRSTGGVKNFSGAVLGEIAEGQMAPYSEVSIDWPHVCFHCKSSEVMTSVAVSPNGEFLAAAWDDSTITLWALEGGSIFRQLHHGDTVLALAFSPDSTRVISGSTSPQATIWTVKAERSELMPQKHTGAITTVAWSSHANWVATGSQDKSISVYNTATGDVGTLVGHESPVTKVTFSPSGESLASSTDWVVFVWNPMTKQKVAELKGHQFCIWSFVFSPDGSKIATASEDLTSRVWDAETGIQITQRNHADTVTSVAFSPDGKEVVTGSSDAMPVSWDPLSGQPRQVFRDQRDAETEKQSSPTELVMYSPDGSFVASGHADGSVRLWDANSATLLARYTGHLGKVRSIDFAYNKGSEYVLTSASDGTIRIWDFLDTLRVL